MSMCEHQPECPPVDQPGWDAASVLVHHAELGWSMLCNGAIVLDAAARTATVTQLRPRTLRRTAAVPLAA
jgi:hypothetical protein